MIRRDVAKKITAHFPFSFTDELIFYKTESFNEPQFLVDFNNLSGVPGHARIIHITKASSLFKVPLKSTLHYQPDLLTVKILFRVSLFELNITLLLFVLFGAFFIIYHQSGVGVTVFVIGLLVYFITLNDNLAHTKKQILQLTGNSLNLDEGDLWRRQKEWLKNPKLCPACGEKKNPYAETCVSCGLNLGSPKKKVEQQQVNSTVDASVNIHYHLKK